MKFRLDDLQLGSDRGVSLTVETAPDHDRAGLLIQAGLTGDTAPSYAYLTQKEALLLADALQRLSAELALTP